MVDRRRASTWLAAVAAGLIIGAVESVLAIAFAALVFGGLLAARLPDGIGLYLGAAALTLAFMAWRSGSRGVVGSVQDAAAAVLGLVASAAAAKAADLAYFARISGVKDYEHPDIFLTVVAATLVVTVLCGILFLVIGRFRFGGLIRFVPYPVVGGFLAGTGWLLFKGGIYVATGSLLHLRTLPAMIREYQLVH
jgi:SulP family sulfate permease